jgi:hydroxyacylglutathione hydrolase
MITIQSFVFNPYQVNCFVLYDETGECIIIDAACHFQKEQEKLQEFISDKSLRPVKLITTHYHFDHILGNRFVKKTWPGISIQAQNNVDLDSPFYDLTAQGRLFGMIVSRPPDIDHLIKHNDVISFGKSKLRAIHVPGHSPCSLVYYCKEQHFAMAGDVLFLEGVGRTDMPDGDHDLLISGIRERLFTLPENTVIYPGHGPETTIGHEKEYNPFVNES